MNIRTHKIGKIVAVCISDKKGVPKKNIRKGILKENYGLIGDAHAGPCIRQVSLLAEESIREIRQKGIKIGCGGFGENLTTFGIELTSLTVGTGLKIGDTAVIEVTQIGKECKRPCKIYKEKGMCILPSQGIFSKVLKGGLVKIGDKIQIIVPGKISTGVLFISDRSALGCSHIATTTEAVKLCKEKISRLSVLPEAKERIFIPAKKK